ncbi:hypothetical protein [Seonamhaeicola maritimus]|uniref:Uncharacterized protein n=1 Tax=Seonamhaeicola maritimus TaxID=2591822 RepID=A0A5C7GL39_9FLAO|nr:hypothetical protein [Seonamhaeicola maritimus]TXG39010.1 hypothetical protein FUA22_03740 [Seonamhaeicola maritimus]
MKINMKPILRLIVFSLTIILFNCKNETIQLEYKYADKPETIICNVSNTKLFQEALYSFEDDIFKYYKKNNFKSTLINAYAQFTRNAINGRIKYDEIISEHSLIVFEALKKDNSLWDSENTKSHLNYNGPLIKCIANNIKDKNLNTTFNSLLSINDLSPKLFGPPLTTKYRNAMNDKYLASFIAFDLYYSKFFDMDLTKINLDKPDTKVDFNKTPQ